MLIGTAVAVVLLLAVGVAGYFRFTLAREDPQRPVDAVVVLGGEHDGRELYGIELARLLRARTVLLSNPYPDSDALMRRLCGATVGGVDVVCRRPEPVNTRGEAIMARQVGESRGWREIAVVTWRYHLPRARQIFAQCYAREPARVVMRAVPRDYDFPTAIWEYIYFYQYAGMVKAAISGPCDL